MGGRRQRGRIPPPPLLRADDQGGNPRRRRRLRQGLLRGVRHPRAERQCPSHRVPRDLVIALAHATLHPRPGESRDPFIRAREAEEWVLAFAGTTALVTAAPLR